MRFTIVNTFVASLVLGTLFDVSWSATPRSEGLFTATQRGYWAFQEVTQPEVPSTSGSFENPIDAFIAARLSERNLQLSPRASKVTLIRRASFDLIGLPPDIVDVEKFLADDSPDAFTRVIDRLLSSPQYGERWARHWLDLARYADSEGFKGDETRPNAWRYRDYVINSFNEDKPYDRFIREQIAGDELWPKDVSAHIATAFNRHYPDETNQWNLWLRRQEILFDITDTVSATFMGLTYECAKCHDHKFDPLLQADYYRLQAFFANSKANDHIPIWSQPKIDSYQKRLKNWEVTTKELRSQIEDILSPTRKEILDDRFNRYYPGIREQLEKPAEEQTPYERQMYAKYRWQMEFLVQEPKVVNKLSEELQQKYKELTNRLSEYEHLHPGELAEGMGIYDLGKKAPPTHVLAVGSYEAPRQEVQPGFPTILDPTDATYRPPENIASTGRRTALANWLANPKNPLSTRVIVNRLWHFHFGRGIVATPSDFGVMGERPTHPKLLDWLTSEFIKKGWSLKKMHRLIMTSKTYQQGSSFNMDANRKDPFNRLLWRYQPQRLEGEVIRDASLFVAGVMDSRVGGPPVFPPLPKHMPEPRCDNCGTLGGWQVSKNLDDHRKRSVYIFVRRNARYPMLEVYDMPDTHQSCARRDVTMTAPQALSYLNDDQSMGWARSFATRLISEAGSNYTDQVDLAYRIAFSRHPDDWEKDAALTFLGSQAQLIEASRSVKGSESQMSSTMQSETIHHTALVDFCHSILNSNEFVFRY